jgi:DNA-binding transcriptional LysR family regulator
LELRQLEYFLAVCELKSFTKAAQKLFVSQPTITSAVISLEKELNVQLLIRSRRGFTLTSEGEVFYNHVKLVMKDVRIAVKQLEQTREKKQKTLRIAVCTFLAKDFFLPAYDAFLDENPGASLIFTECTSQNAKSQLDSESVDAALVIDTPNNAHIENRTDLLTSPVMICVPSGLPHDRVKLLSAIKNGLPVFFCDDSPSLKKEIAARLDLPNDSIFAKVCSADNARYILKKGKSVGFVPGFCDFQATGCNLINAAPALDACFSLYWHENDLLREFIQSFLAFLHKWLMLKIQMEKKHEI